MEQKYRLLPVQVDNLQKLYHESFLKLKALNVVKNEEMADTKVATGAELNLGLDASLLGTISVAKKNYDESREILGNYEVIEPNNSDIIGLGSTFEVLLNYGDFQETEVLTLVEARNVCDSSDLISVFSPCGKAALGKKAGDNIAYMVDGTRITGTVIDVVKENKKTL